MRFIVRATIPLRTLCGGVVTTWIRLRELPEPVEGGPLQAPHRLRAPHVDEV